jgi:hypothetical protein
MSEADAVVVIVVENIRKDFAAAASSSRSPDQRS